MNSCISKYILQVLVSIRCYILSEINSYFQNNKSKTEILLKPRMKNADFPHKNLKLGEYGLLTPYVIAYFKICFSNQLKMSNLTPN